MGDSARRGFAVGLISLSAMAGLAGLTVWLSLFAGVGLTAIAIMEQQKLRARFAASGDGSILAHAHVASLVNSCLTAACAWIVGALLRALVLVIQ